MSFFRSRDKHKKERKGQKDPQGLLQQSHQIECRAMDWEPQALLGSWRGTPCVQGASGGRRALQDAHVSNSLVEAHCVGQHQQKEFWWYAKLLRHGTGEGTPHKPPRGDAAQGHGAL